MYRLLSIAAVLLTVQFLAGCADHSPETEARAEAAALAADAAKCQSYGLQPNTPPYEQCLSKLADQRAGADYVDRAGIMNRLQMRPPTWANF